MSNKTILLALGGNAILQPKQEATYSNQLANVQTSAQFLVKLITQGFRLIVTHGNGPQVGNLLRQNDEAKDVIPPFPLDILTSQTQGFLGFMLQQCLTNELQKANIKQHVACLVSRIEVDPQDPAFKDPSKPIGLFYDEATAQQLTTEKGWILKEDAGRGFRRVVPSPQPKAIVEKEVILKNIDAGFLTIACGGGGIPVAPTANGYIGIEAVIDKDLSGACLAQEVNADMFLIVTDVEHAFINYGKPEQKALTTITIAEMEKYQAEGQFSAGSMGPKVQAAINFVKATKKPAVICALHKVEQAVAGQSGTRIEP